MIDKNPLYTNDEEMAIRLLGRPARSPFKIFTYCADQTPQVLMANSIFDEDGILKPFPTFLWLVCPRLKKAVARLEQDGYIKHFSEKLKDDNVFYDEFCKGQKHVADYRLNMAKEISRELSDEIIRVLTQTTIAGSRDFMGVKCLHSHLAQQLAFRNNPIGRQVLEMAGDCVGNCASYRLKEAV